MSQDLIWSTLITVLVILAAGSVTVLQLAAVKHWSGHWRTVALLPLVVLGLWSALIIISKLLDTNSHSLWPVEIFAWAMLTVIYTVTALTAKKAFAKAEALDTPQIKD